MSNDYLKFCGWIHNPAEVKKMQQKNGIEAINFYSSIEGSGKGKTIFLHKIYEAVTGNQFPVWEQGIGDCVSFGYALAATVLMAVQKSVDPSQLVPADAATEPIYAGSRIEIGNDGTPYDQNEGDGSTGIWGAEWVKEYGILLRKQYNDIDLSAYSDARAKEWGWQGVPNELEPIAKEHPVKNYALVTSYEEARDAIANGYPVVVCSNQGFKQQRDNEGFAIPLGTWAHCMCFVAVDDAYKRPGLLCCNSWGRNWITGPKRHDQPDGSFWVDDETVDKMLHDRDSYAVSNLAAFKNQDMLKVMHNLNIL